MQNIARQTLLTEIDDSELDRELALGKLAERDFPAALDQLDRYFVGRDKISMPTYSMYLYVLAQNGRMDEARAFVDRVSPLGNPPDDMVPFLDWFSDRFDL